MNPHLSLSQLCKITFFGLSMGFISSCLSSTPPPDEHFYFLTAPHSPLEKGRGPRIQVSEFSTGPGYDTARVAYRVASQELRYWSYHQWVAEPSRMLAEMTVRYLRASGRFAEVARGDKLRDPDAIIEATVDAIEEVDLAESWQARLAMTFTVRRGDLDKVLFRYPFDVTVPCDKREVGDVAKKISAIFAAEMDKLGQRLVKTQLR